MLRFVWDEVKSQANLRERGFDFNFASLIFDGFLFAFEDRRRDYGETRVVAVGVAHGIHLTVVFTDRPAAEGEAIRRIISARRSNRRERALYERVIREKGEAKPG